MITAKRRARRVLAVAAAAAAGALILAGCSSSNSAASSDSGKFSFLGLTSNATPANTLTSLSTGACSTAQKSAP